jgi:hypothetical protein
MSLGVSEIIIISIILCLLIMPFGIGAIGIIVLIVLNNKEKK